MKVERGGRSSAGSEQREEEGRASVRYTERMIREVERDSEKPRVGRKPMGKESPGGMRTEMRSLDVDSSKPSITFVRTF